ncbi:Hypothetical protein D9617_13g100440 [Elsinoe fawcettii]|nr:Hypothetical protein D9617_13g100440 [Elsinoe fawcettii]
MATKDLLQLVVLGDKYACTESLTMLAVDQYEKIWRRHAQHPSEHIEECIDMLTIGYLTKRNEIFMEASRMLVNENARQYQDLCKNHRAWPPDFVMMWLEISRMRLKECFFKSLMPALYHECADLPDNHAAIHALKPALGADSDWVRSGSVRGIIELREAFINRAKGDKAFCASCEDGVIPLSVFENEHSEAGGSWYGLCVHCCHARAGDPYKCDGGCIDEDMKADEEHAV